MKSIRAVGLVALMSAIAGQPALAAPLSATEAQQAWDCVAAGLFAKTLAEDAGDAGNTKAFEETAIRWRSKLGDSYNTERVVADAKKLESLPHAEVWQKAVHCNRLARGLNAAQIAAEEEQDRIRAAQSQAESERRQREQAEHEARQQSELASKCQGLADSSMRLAMNVYENAMDTIRNPPSYGWSGSLLSAGCSGIRNAMNEAHSMGCPSEIGNELQRFYNLYYINLGGGDRVDCR